MVSVPSPLFEKEGLGEILPIKAFKNPPQSPFFKGGGEWLQPMSYLFTTP